MRLPGELHAILGTDSDLATEARRHPIREGRAHQAYIPGNTRFNTDRPDALITTHDGIHTIETQADQDAASVSKKADKKRGRSIDDSADTEVNKRTKSKEEAPQPRAAPTGIAGVERQARQRPSTAASKRRKDENDELEKRKKRTVKYKFRV